MCKMETWLLEDYAEGILGIAETTILEAHLHVCNACRQELTHIKLLFWELENLRRDPVEIPAEVESLETAILGEWLHGRESWIRHAGTRANLVVRQAGSQIDSALRQTGGIACQIPGVRTAAGVVGTVSRKTAEVIGSTSRKTVKWLGKTAYNKLQKSAPDNGKDRGSLLMNLMGGAG
jgi:hypothetical protein